MGDPDKWCKHRIYRDGHRSRCTRNATDTDGLCNVCRSEARLRFILSTFSYDPARVEVSREWLLHTLGLARG
jgi:hypothetical protein